MSDAPMLPPGAADAPEPSLPAAAPGALEGSGSAASTSPAAPPPTAGGASPAAGGAASAAPAATSTATATAAATAAPPKPRGLVRWGFLAVLLAGSAGATVALKDKVALSLVRSIGSQALGGALEVESASVQLKGGVVTVKKIVARDPSDPESERFSAEQAVIDLDLAEALRGRVVVEELRLTRPRGKVVRRKDGSIGIGEGAGAPGEPAPGEPGAPAGPEVAGGPGTPGGEPGASEPSAAERWRERARRLEEEARKRDFVADLQKALEEIRRRLDERRAREEAERLARAQGLLRDPSGRARWVRGQQPLVVVRRLICDDVEVEVRDEAAGAPPIRLVETRLEVRNLSSDPLLHPDPLEIDLQGRLADAASSLLRIHGGVDMKVERLRSDLVIEAKDIPAHLFDALVQDTLPFRLEPGMLASVRMPLSFDDFAIDWKPVLDLAHIAVSARDPSKRTIAGFDSAKVIQALREVESIRFEDVRVFGSVFGPSVETGQTLQTLVTEGGKAYAARRATEEAARLGARAEGAIQERTGRLIEKAGGSELLQGAAAVGGVAAEGTAKEATEGAKRAIRGLFGGGEDKSGGDR